MMMILWSTIIATLVGLASAAVIPRDTGFKTLSQAQIHSTDTYANYAAAAACPLQSLTYWNCGTTCSANSNFQISSVGGDGTDIPQWIAGYDSALDSILVVHQGNDGPNFFQALANANPSSLMPLDPTIFPNITSDIQVYGPYAQVHAQTVSAILQVLGPLVQQYPDATVTTIGYSMGGALALLDAVLFRMLLGPTTEIRTVLYGMSRVGNEQFVNFVDALLPASVKNIVNMNDPYPVTPSLALGFHGVAGEIHIQDSDGKWIVCPGDDNADPRCIAGTVTSLNDANFSNHIGPYDSITISCTGS